MSTTFSEGPQAGGSEGTLVRRWRQGDRRAGARLFERHQKGLLEWIGRHLGRPGEDATVRDISQEVWTSLCEHDRKRLGDYNWRKGTFFTFLVLRARHAMADMEREQGRRHEIPLAHGLADPEDGHDSEGQVQASMEDLLLGLSPAEAKHLAERVAPTGTGSLHSPRARVRDRKADQRLKEKVHGYCSAE